MNVSHKHGATAGPTQTSTDVRAEVVDLSESPLPSSFPIAT